MKKRTRKRFLIDRQLQGALAFRIFCHWVIFSCVAAVLTLLMLYVGNPFAPWSEHFDSLWQNQGAFALVIGVLLPIFIFDSIRLSNRFAGPVVRLRRAMQEIGEGKPVAPITFRDGDFWAGMAADYNKLIELGYLKSDSTGRVESAIEPHQEIHEKVELGAGE